MTSRLCRVSQDASCIICRGDDTTISLDISAIGTRETGPQKQSQTTTKCQSNERQVLRNAKRLTNV